jgi:hypothetical protein
MLMTLSSALSTRRTSGASGTICVSGCLKLIRSGWVRAAQWRVFIDFAFADCLGIDISLAARRVSDCARLLTADACNRSYARIEAAAGKACATFEFMLKTAVLQLLRRISHFSRFGGGRDECGNARIKLRGPA